MRVHAHHRRDMKQKVQLARVVCEDLFGKPQTRDGQHIEQRVDVLWQGRDRVH